MSWISSTTFPIRFAASLRDCTSALVDWACCTAFRLIEDPWATCELISRIEALSSSAAAETVCTLEDALCAFDAMREAWSPVLRMAELMPVALLCMLPAAEGQRFDNRADAFFERIGEADTVLPAAAGWLRLPAPPRSNATDRVRGRLR